MRPKATYYWNFYRYRRSGSAQKWFGDFWHLKSVVEILKSGGVGEKTIGMNGVGLCVRREVNGATDKLNKGAYIVKA